jgi:uncharacterized protein Yka (UPF0111/DUF47 family)
MHGSKKEHVSLKSLRGILVIGERNIFGELSQIISIAVQANAIVKAAFQANYDEKTLAEAMETVRALEKKSDKVAFMITEDVTSGAISPNIIDNLLECIHIADNLVDVIYYLSREMNRMSKAKSINFEAHQNAAWSSDYLNLSNLAEASILKLEKIFSTESITEISKLRNEIEALEEQGDDVKDAGFDKLYRLAPELSYLQFIHYSELLHKCDDILDSCEDLADLVVSIVTSILK